MKVIYKPSIGTRIREYARLATQRGREIERIELTRDEALRLHVEMNLGTPGSGSGTMRCSGVVLYWPPHTDDAPGEQPSAGFAEPEINVNWKFQKDDPR